MWRRGIPLTIYVTILLMSTLLSIFPYPVNATSDVDDAINKGLAWLDRRYMNISPEKAVIKNAGGLPFRIYIRETAEWRLAGTEYCIPELITITSTKIVGRYKFEEGDNWDYNDLIIYFEYSSDDSDTMKLYVKMEKYGSANTIEVWIGFTQLWVGNHEGESKTLYKDYGWSTLAYSPRHASRMAAHLYEALGQTEKANKLNKLMDDAGYTKDVYDPLFGKSNDYPDDFFFDPTTWEGPNYAYDPYWAHLPRGDFLYPYKSRLLAAGAQASWIGDVEEYTPRHECLKALHLMNKYGYSRLDEAKQLIDSAGWDGYGCRRTIHFGPGQSLTYTYTAYPTYVTGCYLAAVSKYAGMTGDPEYIQKAREACGVILSCQWTYPFETVDYGDVYFADEIGGFITSYLPYGSIAWHPQWGPFVDAFYELLDKMNYFEQQAPEKVIADFVNAESTIICIQALRIYKQYLGSYSPIYPEEIKSNVKEADYVYTDGWGSDWYADGEKKGLLELYASGDSEAYASLKIHFEPKETIHNPQFNIAIHTKGKYFGECYLKLWLKVWLYGELQLEKYWIIYDGSFESEQSVDEFHEVKFTWDGNLYKYDHHVIEIGCEVLSYYGAEIDFWGEATSYDWGDKYIDVLWCSIKEP